MAKHGRGARSAHLASELQRITTQLQKRDNSCGAQHASWRSPSTQKTSEPAGSTPFELRDATKMGQTGRAVLQHPCDPLDSIVACILSWNRNRHFQSHRAHSSFPACKGCQSSQGSSHLPSQRLVPASASGNSPGHFQAAPTQKFRTGVIKDIQRHQNQMVNSFQANLHSMALAASVSLWCRKS